MEINVCAVIKSGLEGFDLQVDHIKPKSLYPKLALDFDNLQILCYECNNIKSNQVIVDFRHKDIKVFLFGKWIDASEDTKNEQLNLLLERKTGSLRRKIKKKPQNKKQSIIDTRKYQKDRDKQLKFLFQEQIDKISTTSQNKNIELTKLVNNFKHKYGEDLAFKILKKCNLTSFGVNNK